MGAFNPFYFLITEKRHSDRLDEGLQNNTFQRGSKGHIPEDLWPEILSRLPVKSLLRFRCISKSWLSMINDPDFCRLHLKNFKNNRDETHLLVVQGRKKNFALCCSKTFKPIAEAVRTEEGSWEVEGSIDGLVLLKSCNSKVSGLYRLRVWNPSIRKFHDIPSLPEIEAFANSSFFDEDIGLGYDPLAKDYKNVKLIFVNRMIPHSAAVYTLGARSWKTVPFQGKGCSNWRCMDLAHKTTVCLRGSLYFTASDAGREVMELVSIDLSTELFSCTNLPSGVLIGDGYLNASLTLVDDRSTLALLDFVQGAMWVLDSSSASEPACWIRRYSFHLDFHEFLYHKKNGDVLLWSIKNISFKLPGGTKQSQWFSILSAYNPETKEEGTLLMQQGYDDFEIHYACGYVECLNLLI